MAVRNRSNPLALAVLMCLLERPMHPYEVATTLRQRGKHESIRLNYGSLYAVIESLQRRRLIEAAETQKAGRLPERTVYRLTDAGAVEALDWLTELVSVPAREYPGFVAGLSFLAALPPQQTAELLEQRAGHLEMELVQREATCDVLKKHHLPRLLWVEVEFMVVVKKAELDYVKRLARDIRSGDMEGLEWWRQVHEEGLDGPPAGFIPPGVDMDQYLEVEVEVDDEVGVDDSYRPGASGPGGQGEET